MPRERTAAVNAGTAPSLTTPATTIPRANRSIGGSGGSLNQNNFGTWLMRAGTALDSISDNIGATSSAEANAASAASAYAAMAQSSREAAANRDFQERFWEKTSAYNALEAQKNRDWQERMSNTAYQRAMADMRAAGLNPILAYQQGGASTPSGGSAAVGTLGGAMGTGYSYQAMQDNSDTIKLISILADTAVEALMAIGKDVTDAGGLKNFLRSLK